MTEGIKKAVIAIWDRSKGEKVDVGVSESKIRSDIINGDIADITLEDLAEAGKIGRKHYNEICDAYVAGDMSVLDDLQ